MINTVTKIISHRHDNPYDTLQQIGDAFGVSRQYIYKVLKQNNVPTIRAKKMKNVRHCKICGEISTKLVHDGSCRFQYYYTEINCATCKKSFHRTRSLIKQNLEQGSTNHYCTRQCYSQAKKSPKASNKLSSSQSFNSHKKKSFIKAFNFLGTKLLAKVKLNDYKSKAKTIIEDVAVSSIESNIKELTKIKIATNIGKEIENYVQKLQKQKVIETTPKHVVKNKKEINSSVVVEKEFNNNIPQPSFKEKVKITNSRSFPEAELTARFKGFMDDRGVELSKLKIGLYENDIYIKEKDILIEAKPDVSSPNFRMVLGQIIHYNYLLEKGIKKPNYVAALFPEKPPDDFIEMFSTSLRYKIYVIWETNKGYFDNNLPEGVL